MFSKNSTEENAANDSEENGDLSKLTIAGKDFRFALVMGRVLESKTWTETHIHSTDAEVRYHYDGSRNTPYVIPPKIQSTVVTITEIWIVDESGRQRSFRLYNADFPTRRGNIVSFIFGGHETDSDLHNIGVINHTTGRSLVLSATLNEVVSRNVKSVSIGALPMNLLIVLFAFLMEFCVHPQGGLIGNIALTAIVIMAPLNAVYFLWLAHVRSQVTHRIITHMKAIAARAEMFADDEAFPNE